MSSKKLFLLDGHALVFRAHYAFISRPLINSKGMNTSAITGFVRSLWEILRKQQPTHIAVSFDLSKKTFRNEIYPAYKANRDATPEDIVKALPYIMDIVKGFNIPVVTKQNYEADDVIGTLAKQAEKEGFTVYMVTPDKDYAQLVSENIFMWKPARMGNGVEILGVPEILKKWQIERIDQVIDVLGLQGDSVDNIPGIPGVGPKTAVKLLAAYGDIEGVIANVDKLKGKQQERVRDFADQARLSKILATIDLNVPVEFHERDFRLDPMNKDALAVIFKDLEFRTLASQILGSAPVVGTQTSMFGKEVSASDVVDKAVETVEIKADKTVENVEHSYHLAMSESEINQLIDVLSKSKIFAFDTETTGLDAHVAELVGMSFSVKEHEAWYVPVSDNQEEAKALVAKFHAVFANDKIAKIGQNIKYDITMLQRYGLEINGELEDTMILHYLVEPELRHNMDYLAESYLSYRPMSITNLIGKKGKNQLSMRQVELEKIKEYAAEDADITLQLFNFLNPWMKKEKLDELYTTIEQPLISVLSRLESNGIKLNSDFLNEYSVELAKDITETEKSIYALAERPFNIASPRQVGTVLFEQLKIPYRWTKTKTGQYSTNEEKLTELAADNEIVKRILHFRMLSKLKSTYVDALPRMVNPNTGRIHSSFNQALASTGRLSSNNPNLQNIPIRTAAGRKVRMAFVPKDDDHILLAADYSQIELRLIAHISNEEAMLDAFQKNQDIHRATAAKVYGVEYDAVTDDQRRAAKTVNFSIIYGAGATNLSKQLNIKRGEAKELISQYFAQYQGLKKYMDETVNFARENGYVETMMGRKRKLRDINSRNGMARSGAERIAVNTPVQGSAADMIKLAMIDIDKFLTDGNYKSKMILQVHDELVFDIYKPELDILKPVIEEKMRTAISDLKVPIVVSMDTGNNWLEAH